MADPSIDIENPNVIGKLDKLTTNIAICIVAVGPTLLCGALMPWRLAPLLVRDEPEGRMGMLLAPGAFFPLALLVTMIAAALMTTSEISNNDGAFLGPALAVSIQTAMADGDIWKTIGIIMPIYGFAVVTGTFGLLLKPFIHPDWTLRVSLRAVFYTTAVLVSWIILTTAALDLFRVTTGRNELTTLLYNLIPIPTLSGLFWMYFCFIRGIGAVGWIKTSLLSVAMIALNLFAVISIGALSGN